MEAQQTKKISISRRVINAILRLQKSKGVSLVDLKKYLRNDKNLDVEKYNEEIKLALKEGLDRDILTRENGVYKVKEAKRAREKQTNSVRSRNPQKSSKLKTSTRMRSPSQPPRKKAFLKS